MKFDNKEEYLKHRDKLVNDAEKLVEDNKIQECNNIIKMIKEEDLENNFLNEDDPIALANKRALEDNRKVTDLNSLNVNIENGAVIDSLGGEKVTNLFLNKCEKLQDRVKATEEEKKNIK